jgi:hypothetical protein
VCAEAPFWWLAPGEQVAPQQETAYPRAGEQAGGLDPHVARGQRPVGHRHRVVRGLVAEEPGAGEGQAESVVRGRGGELDWQLPRQIRPGERDSGEDAARPQPARHPRQRLGEIEVVEHRRAQDGVVGAVRNIGRQGVGQVQRDVRRGEAPGLLDHHRRPVDALDERHPPGKSPGEGAGAATDVQHPFGARRHLGEKQPAVPGVVVPVRQPHPTRIHHALESSA